MPILIPAGFKTSSIVASSNVGAVGANNLPIGNLLAQNTILYSNVWASSGGRMRLFWTVTGQLNYTSGQALIFQLQQDGATLESQTFNVTGPIYFNRTVSTQPAAGNHTFRIWVGQLQGVGTSWAVGGIGFEEVIP